MSGEKQLLPIEVFYQSHVNGLSGSGTERSGLCPFHADTSKSFSANMETGLVFCHAENRGWNLAQFAEELGVPLPPELSTRNASFSSETTYTYVNERGEIVYQVLRGVPKSFRCRRPDGQGGWIWNLQGVQRILYRLPEIQTAEWVHIVEGEKDVDTLRALGLVATCNPGGAGKWRSEYNEALRGKKVILLPDHDEPGRAHMETIAQQLQGVAAEVRVVALNGLPEKGDVSDWLGHGHTKEELQQLVDTAPIYQPVSTGIDTLPLICSADIPSHLLTEGTTYVVDRLIPLCNLIFFNGPPGVTKTTYLINMMWHVAEGIFYDGKPTLQRKVVFIDRENSLGFLNDRFIKIGRSKNFFVWTATCDPQPPLLPDIKMYLPLAKEGWVIVFDSFRRFHNRDENSSTEMALVMNALLDLRNAGGTVVVLHHTDKANLMGYRGSSEILGATDVAYVMEREGS